VGAPLSGGVGRANAGTTKGREKKRGGEKKTGGKREEVSVGAKWALGKRTSSGLKRIETTAKKKGKGWDARKKRVPLAGKVEGQITNSPTPLHWGKAPPKNGRRKEDTGGAEPRWGARPEGAASGKEKEGKNKKKVKKGIPGKKSNPERGESEDGLQGLKKSRKGFSKGSNRFEKTKAS